MKRPKRKLTKQQSDAREQRFQASFARLLKQHEPIFKACRDAEKLTGKDMMTTCTVTDRD